MNDASKNSDNELDLSALSFGPAWARDEEKKKDYSQYEVRDKPDGDRRKKKGRGDNQRSRSSFQANENGRRKEKSGRGNPRDGQRREYKPRYEIEPAPEGFVGEIMPIEDGLDRLAKQILQTARTYSVFDLARMILQSRERYNVGIRAPKGQKLFRNTVTAATFLTKEEAMEDFWKSEVKNKFYQEVKKEVEAPAGNYPSVARCRKSGVYLGPPNHHEYQVKVRELHQARFAHLPLEVVQRGIEITSEEEAVQAWIEQEKYQTYYLPLSSVSLSGEAPAAEPSAEAVEAHATQEEASEEKVGEEVVEQEGEEPVAEQMVEEAAPSVSVDESLLLKTRAELERHFLTNHFDEAYKQVQISWVPSAIPRKMLSPSLLTLLKETVSEERRYPGKLSSLMCRQLSGRNVAVFKLNKKLKAGPSRPHALPDVSKLADRPRALLDWAAKNDGQGIDKLWKAVLPENVTEEEKTGWYHDLKWLLIQGYASLLEDGTLLISKKEEREEGKGGAKKVGAERKTSTQKKEGSAAAGLIQKTVHEGGTSAQAEGRKGECSEKETEVSPGSQEAEGEQNEGVLTDSDIAYLEISQRIETLTIYARAREKRLLAEAQKKQMGVRRVENIGKSLSARGLRAGRPSIIPCNLPSALNLISQR